MRNKYPVRNHISRIQNGKLYKLYKTTQLTPDTIHNLAVPVKIPFYIKTILCLGLNYSVSVPPNFQSIKHAFKEGLRKIGWITHFKIFNKESSFNEFDKLLHNFKKFNNKNFSNFHSTEEGILFDKNTVSNFMRQVVSKYKSQPVIVTELINSLHTFMEENNLILKPADKNAGVCIMFLNDYENEIFCQLHR